MHILSLVSLKGGTGRTALAAHLGTILAQARMRCLVLDMDPQNGLGHWFGMQPGERIGFARRGLGHEDLVDFVRREQPDVHYLPFGATTPDELVQLEAEMMGAPDWLASRVKLLADADYDLVLLDTVAGQGEWTRQALRASDLALGVLLADPASYATVPALRDLLARTCDIQPAFLGSMLLLNQMDARVDLQRDVRSSLLRAVPDLALQVTVPFDAALREALGRGQTLFHRSPDSQVIESLREVAGAVVQRIEEGVPVTPQTLGIGEAHP